MSSSSYKDRHVLIYERSRFYPIIRKVIAMCTDASTTSSDIVDNHNSLAERLFWKAAKKDPDTTNSFMYWDLITSFSDGLREVKELLASDGELSVLEKRRAGKKVGNEDNGEDEEEEEDNDENDYSDANDGLGKAQSVIT